MWNKLALCACVVFAALSANTVLCFDAAPAVSTKQISGKKAVAIARRITGYPKAEVVHSESRLVAGDVFPFGPRKKRPVWEITLKGISLADFEGETNKLIKGLTVLLDAESGNLIRIDSIPKVTGYVKRLFGREPENILKNEFSIIGPSPPTKITFADAITTFGSWNVIPQAKQISAYLIVVAGEPDTRWPRKASYWVIVAGGFRAHVFLETPQKVTTEAMNLVEGWSGGSVMQWFHSSPGTRRHSSPK